MENCCRGTPPLARAGKRNRSAGRPSEKKCQYGKYDFKNNISSTDCASLCGCGIAVVHPCVCVWEEVGAATTRGCGRISLLEQRCMLLDIRMG